MTNNVDPATFPTEEMDSLDETSPAERREQLRADVALMVALRVSKWRDIELHETAFMSREEDTTQRRMTIEEQEQAAREERRRVAMAASGRPVKRSGADSIL